MDVGKGTGRGSRTTRGRGLTTDTASTTGRGSAGLSTTGRGSNRGRGSTTDIAVVSQGRASGRGRSQIVVEDFEQATSSNLPLVTPYSVAEYYKNLISPELRQSKDQRY